MLLVEGLLESAEGADQPKLGRSQDWDQKWRLRFEGPFQNHVALALWIPTRHTYRPPSQATAPAELIRMFATPLGFVAVPQTAMI